MGTEAAWIPAVIALIGAGVQQYNTSQTAKKRDADIARGIREAGIQQERANKKIGENLDELSTSRAEPYKKELTDIFLDKVQKKRLQGLAGLDTAGSTSAAYKTGAKDAKTGAIDYAGTISDLLAGVDAAGNQRQAEDKGKNSVTMDLLKFGRNADQDSFLAQLRAARHRDNPWLSIAASGLSGYGAAGGDFGLGKTASTGVAGAGPYGGYGTPVFNPNTITGTQYRGMPGRK